MIDPTKISNFNLNDDELEENILFWILAAGKNGVTAAKLLNNLLRQYYVLCHDTDLSPFTLIKTAVLSPEQLAHDMKSCGIGCYNNKSKTIYDLVHSNINLRTCSLDDLLKFKGIGPKTARAFLVHTRSGQKYAVIDTHILKFLRDQGIITPKSTPPEGPKYRDLEADFLDICDLYRIDSHTLDLDVWNHYRQTPDIPFDLQERYGIR